MKSIATALFAYGAFLIVAGLAGYLSNPEKAKTALMSGGTFGLLNIGLGILALRGWRPSARVALGVATFLGLIFTWRSSVSWMAVADGQSEKIVAGSIISAMLIATVTLVVYLVRAKGKVASSAS